MVFLTGDTHRDFARVELFCQRAGTTKADILVILGDAGINYLGGEADRQLKGILAGLPITLLCIHGNHEQRPQSIAAYEERPWGGGVAYVEPDFPSLIFAKDGEVYELAGRRCIALGGAYSVDKAYRLARGLHWWPDEQPDDAVKAAVEAKLDAIGWRVDAVLSHTCPQRYEPREVFLKSIDQAGVDKGTEAWLDTLEKRLDYGHWYCGHFHTDKVVDRLRFLMFDFIELR